MAAETSRTSEACLARLVWATHILSYLESRNHVPLSKDREGKTSQSSYRPESPRSGPETSTLDDLAEDIDGDDVDSLDIPDDLTSRVNVPLVAQNEPVRHKFLVYLAQILSAAKGGRFVVATALCEFEDSAEIDVAMNHAPNDREQYKRIRDFHILFERFMAEVSSAPLVSIPRIRSAFMDKAIEYSRDRLRIVLGKLLKLLQPLQPLLSDLSIFKDQPTRFVEIVETLQHWIKRGSNHISTSQLKEWSKAASNISFYVELEGTVSYLVSRSSRLASHQINILRSIKFFGNPGRAIMHFTKVARYFPQFGRITIELQSKNEAVALNSKLRVTLETAWSALDLPQSTKLVTISKHKFQNDCAEALHVHAEMQLMLLYEAEPRKVPTTRFIGVSKKACLLCESALSLCPIKFDVIGRHGKLYPRWAFPVGVLSQYLERLEDITAMVRHRILEVISQDSKALTNAVAESTLIPESTATEWADAKSRQKDVKHIESAAEQHRIQRGLREDPTRIVRTKRYQSVGVPKYDESTECLICSRTPASLAACCKLVRYCSENCREIDSSGHDSLCRQLKDLAPRPSEAHFRAILFPCDESEAHWIWLDSQQNTNEPFYRVREHIWEVLGPAPTVDDYILCQSNLRRGYNLTDTLITHCREAALFDGSGSNRSIEAALGKHDLMGYDWRGPVVVTCTVGRPSLPNISYKDITLSDLRTVLDQFVTYMDDFVRQYDGGQRQVPNSVLGVVVNCIGEQQLHGSDELSAVEVPLTHPILVDYVDNGNPCIPKYIGVPLVARRIHEPKSFGSQNMAQYELSSENHFIKTFFHATVPWMRQPAQFLDCNIGNVLLIRHDREDLMPQDVRKMHEFCLQMKDVVDNASRDGTTGAWMTLMDYITPERFEAYKAGKFEQHEDITEEAIAYSNLMKERFGGRFYDI